MNKEEILSLLNANDFQIDPLGRFVIENEELLKAIHGSLGQMNTFDTMSDVACSNTGCSG